MKNARRTKHDRVPRAVVIAGVIALVVGGLTIVGGVVYLMLTPDGPPPAVQTSMDLIAADTTDGITVGPLSAQETRQQLRQTVRSAPAPASPGDIRVFPVLRTEGDKTQMPLTDLFTRLSSTMPDSLLQIAGPQYVFGIIGPDKIPFFVFRVENTGNAYGPMREWERTMGADLGAVLSPTNQAEGGSFSTSVVRNKEARVYTASADTPIVSYMFLDDTTVAITSTPNVLDALRSARRSADRFTVNYENNLEAAKM